MLAKIGEYQGKPTISIVKDEEDDFPIISMGVRKASALLQCVPDLVKFVATHGTDIQKKAVSEFYKDYKPVSVSAAAANGEPKKSKKIKPVQES